MSEVSFHYNAELIEPGRCWECGASSMGHGKTVYDVSISNQSRPILKAVLGKNGVYELSYMSTTKAVTVLEPAIARVERAMGLANAFGAVRLGVVQLFLSHMLLVSRQQQYSECMWRVL